MPPARRYPCAGSSKSSPTRDTSRLPWLQIETTYRARGPLPPGDPDRAEAAARAVDPRSMPPFAVVRAMVEHVPEFLRGEKTGEDILFAPTRLAALVRLLLQRQPALRDQQPPGRRGRRAGPSGGPAGDARRDRRRLGIGGPRGRRAARAGGPTAADRAIRVHRDRPDVPAPRRAHDPRPLSRPSRRVRPPRHGPGFRGAGRRRRGSPTSSTPSTRSTSPATSRRRSRASARR